jgi:hypothetical protein
MKKIIVLFLAVLLILSCQTTELLDPDTNIAIEVTNIPDQYYGCRGYAHVYFERTLNSPQLEMEINSDTFAGILKYKNGTEWKIGDRRRNMRYAIFFIIVKQDESTITRFSRQYLIRSATILLDYNNDFYDSADEAIRNFN